VRRSTALALVCGFATLSSAAVARAATCPAHGDRGPIAAPEARERLFLITRQLEEESRRGHVWAYGWGVGIGAAGVASLAVVPFVPPSQRVDWYTSAATAAIGVVPFIVAPLKVTRTGPALSAAIAAAPLDDDARVCALVADAEHTLAEAAANERVQRSWWLHAGNLAFNTGVFLFLGLGFHHWSAGAVNGLAGAAVGEAIIFSQPTGAIDAEASYARF
jgi:hypothetical protein